MSFGGAFPLAFLSTTDSHRTSNNFLMAPNNNAVAETGIDSTTLAKPQIKAVIFDLDGTLLDTESLSCRAVLDSFDLTGVPIPRDKRDYLKKNGDVLPWELKGRILGLRGSEWIPIVLAYAQEKWGVEMTLDWCNSGDDFSEERTQFVDLFWKAWEARLNELCSEVKSCPGAPELVEALRSSHVPLAIATSSRAASVQKKRCNHEKMFQSFQEIVTGDDENVKNGKPAPDIYLEAAKRLGVHPSECLVFEDALTGAQSGKSAGCHVVAVPDPRMGKDLFIRENVADDILASLWQFSGEKWGLPFGLGKSSPSSPLF